MSKVWEVAATINAILGLAEDLIGVGVERVVVESTSDYWRHGEHDAVALAGMAKGRLRSKRSALVDAMDGRFDDHHTDPRRALS